jgi:hypothetical protein
MDSYSALSEGTGGTLTDMTPGCDRSCCVSAISIGGEYDPSEATDGCPEVLRRDDCVKVSNTGDCLKVSNPEDAIGVLSSGD